MAKFAELVDIDQLRVICESFTRLTGAVTAILELDGQVLVSTGWQDVCTRFHRVHPATAQRCHESDTYLAGALGKGESFNLYRCRNGLVDVAIPIAIDGEHVANFFTGQFLLEPPDREQFSKQAREHGFPLPLYLEALDRVPILSADTIQEQLTFFRHLTRLIGESGSARRRAEAANESLRAELAERHRAESALRESRAMLHQVIDTVPQSVFWKDEGGRYLGCNRVFAAAAGLGQPDEIVGKTDFELPWREDGAAAYRRDDREVMESRRAKLHIEEQLRHADGRLLWIDTSKAPLLDEDGRPFGVLGVYEDVTERKRAQKEREDLQEQLLRAQKLESIGRLAGGIAHDFNNMLGVILGSVEFALEQLDEGDELAGELASIKAAAERSADLTRQLLAFARRQPIQARVLELNGAIAGTLKMLRRVLGAAIELQFHPSKPEIHVCADPAQLDQVLTNLCMNARDATRGFGNIRVETRTVERREADGHARDGAPPGVYACIEVKDDGRGIPPEILGSIFEPFFTTKGVGEGTGLGLATVYGIAKQNGGFVEVDSQLGMGSAFRVFLPLRDGDATTAAARPTASSRGHELVLLVDDEPGNLRLSMRALERAGYVVLAAGSPAEALELCERHLDDLRILVTDVLMPGMSGVELSARVRGRAPAVRTLLLSGYPRDELGTMGVDSDALFLPKPFTGRALVDKVREALDA